ncbi:hypothetical protein EVAR_13005_1 [Eumeta japonica]|uniref:Uncharacterized protein n=1 Tax=Eumeta variegata TaxID=151549 RepID=A0A4C1TXD0_EUMVA|nr:hypothetical protein EVAR_13005_1 [Eumeta japonica]
MDDKIDDACELMKDRRLDILYENETKRKEYRETIAEIVRSYSVPIPIPASTSRCRRTHVSASCITPFGFQLRDDPAIERIR